MERGKVLDDSLFSQSLGEDVPFFVYLPPNYSTLYKYNVAIASDGKDYIQLGRVPRILDEFAEKEDWDEWIFVGIPYANVKERRARYHPDGEQMNAYLRFLAHELVPYLDREYPTLHMGNSRALLGDSLAGTISLTAALTYPNTFGRVMMHSPFVNDRVLEKVQQTQDLSSLTLFHAIGKEETKVRMTNGETWDFLTTNRELNKHLTPTVGDYVYRELDGDHTWKTWQPNLRHALSYTLYGTELE
ncbi:alpha/beta hydrolase [Bacillus fonticola]|uniref:alpha/beta hydrolase n=1 Tax=Bacillus fonticola TaxID=2728853 RepID=UPI0014752A79|nr:alpha/beta hydrolase-fold protein [Bacillus fonticola]